MDCSPPGSSVLGILQARKLEWIDILFSRESPQPRDLTWVSYIAGRFFSLWATRQVHVNPYVSPILEWVACPFSSGSPWPRNQTGVSCIVGGFFTNWAIREAHVNPYVSPNYWSPLISSIFKRCMLSLQSCLTLFDPTDSSPPSSSVHEILQARIQEWVAVPSSKGSSPPRDRIWVSYSPGLAGGFFITEPLGKSLFKGYFTWFWCRLLGRKTTLKLTFKMCFPFFNWLSFIR